jgi:hypothetical protein
MRGREGSERVSGSKETCAARQPILLDVQEGGTDGLTRGGCGGEDAISPAMRYGPCRRVIQSACNVGLVDGS